MHKVGTIQIEEYYYNLPNERIAKFPLENRDQSKLLFLKEREVSERKFVEIPGLLPKNSLLIFNETKVIRARLLFRKQTGALIEIFCLEPVEPSNDFQIAFQETSPVVWKCLVGNAKRWKNGELEMKLEKDGKTILLKAKMLEKLTDAFLVRFSWEPVDLVFSEIIEQSGLVPLPPYLNREAEETDKTRYQTVYAKFDGSVAAPTAGLHFTDGLLDQIQQKGIECGKVTLHVGAGTFKPVIASSIADHKMHTEKIVISMCVLKQLGRKIGDPIIPVGTTSMRTMESLFWIGLKLYDGDESLSVEQWDPYQLKIREGFTSAKALEVIISYLEKNNIEELKAETRLMIAPGYEFKICLGIVTNFHQPKSTLLLLVSALIGKNWKTAYDFALQNDFRFLSYGDSCLFLP